MAIENRPESSGKRILYLMPMVAFLIALGPLSLCVSIHAQTNQDDRGGESLEQILKAMPEHDWYLLRDECVHHGGPDYLSNACGMSGLAGGTLVHISRDGNQCYADFSMGVGQFEPFWNERIANGYFVSLFNWPPQDLGNDAPNNASPSFKCESLEAPLLGWIGLLGSDILEAKEVSEPWADRFWSATFRHEIPHYYDPRHGTEDIVLYNSELTYSGIAKGEVRITSQPAPGVLGYEKLATVVGAVDPAPDVPWIASSDGADYFIQDSPYKPGWFMIRVELTHVNAPDFSSDTAVMKCLNDPVLEGADPGIQTDTPTCSDVIGVGTKVTPILVPSGDEGSCFTIVERAGIDGRWAKGDSSSDTRRIVDSRSTLRAADCGENGMIAALHYLFGTDKAREMVGILDGLHEGEEVQVDIERLGPERCKMFGTNYLPPLDLWNKKKVRLSRINGDAGYTIVIQFQDLVRHVSDGDESEFTIAIALDGAR